MPSNRLESAIMQAECLQVLIDVVADIDVFAAGTEGHAFGYSAERLAGADAQRAAIAEPARMTRRLTRAGLSVREETAFQGGDGYLLFGSEGLASATIARIAEHVFDEDALPNAQRLPSDPVYADPDFAADFFLTIQKGMEGLVENRGYAALLGTFGPALLDPTGSRPGARQAEGVGGPATIRHPRELRAIPNNAILQQLGWCANTLQGLGAALARHPAEFAELMNSSPRFRRAIDFARHALRHSDLDVLHAIIATLDPTNSAASS
jgi:phosphoenolpyruvate carboxylase